MKGWCTSRFGIISGNVEAAVSRTETTCPDKLGETIARGLTGMPRISVRTCSKSGIWEVRTFVYSYAMPQVLNIADRGKTHATIRTQLHE